MLDKLTKKDFEALTGATFSLPLADKQNLSLVLVEVKSLGVRDLNAAGVPDGITRLEPFSVVFRGAHEMPLAQGTFMVTNETIGDFAGLFLVPVAEDKDGRYYEAVFN